eukprot:CAMPEP_0172481502 /NCGR_PEP_ID=MMETSP1066-20121228/7415_1 /TAXON_ID=671091 /ORGANISM="Coscinodiscus wailesii, Strain CCMP2513" /LENGTH=244 /DNA_ID=CAMNT_0013243853 /DNA_START=65 /DNA_END=799 /DNA_ORIENTATION=+
MTKFLPLALLLIHSVTKNADAFANQPRRTTSSSKTTDAVAERKPWDAIRFIKQSSKFVPMPTLLRPKKDKVVIKPGDTLWEPGVKYDFQWSPLDDVVMGGASSSTFDNETGLWTGTVTSANNGGFVGVRTTPFSSALDMESCRGIELLLRGGDGKKFKAIVRDSTDFNGVCWTSSFDTRGKGVKLPFAKQVPTIFANTVKGQTFQKNNVLGLQLTYSKFEYDGGLNPNFSLGHFSLQVLKIKAF